MNLNIKLSEEDINSIAQRTSITTFLPEITAKAYAAANGLTTQTVNNMCSRQLLPARKMNTAGVCINNIERGTWWINLVLLKKQLEI